MKKNIKLCFMLLLGVLGLCGCCNSENEVLQIQIQELQKQNEEMKKQNEEMSRKLEEIGQETKPETTKTPEPTATPIPTVALPVTSENDKDTINKKNYEEFLKGNQVVNKLEPLTINDLIERMEIYDPEVELSMSHRYIDLGGDGKEELLVTIGAEIWGGYFSEYFIVRNLENQLVLLTRGSLSDSHSDSSIGYNGEIHSSFALGTYEGESLSILDKNGNEKSIYLYTEEYFEPGCRYYSMNNKEYYVYDDITEKETFEKGIREDGWYNGEIISRDEFNKKLAEYCDELGVARVSTSKK